MEHDYNNARRGAVLSSTGKTRITMYLDDDVLQHFRQTALVNGRGYQTEINLALRHSLEHKKNVVVREASHMLGAYQMVNRGVSVRSVNRTLSGRKALRLSPDQRLERMMFAGGEA